MEGAQKVPGRCNAYDLIGCVGGEIHFRCTEGVREVRGRCAEGVMPMI